MPLAPPSHTGQQPPLSERRQHRHSNALRVPAGRGGRRLHAVFQLRERRLHAAQQRFPRGIEHHASSQPLEQREPQLLLESADLLADGAVREMQHLGRRTKILQLADSAKCIERVEG
jgi:hypothetical protein